MKLSELRPGRGFNLACLLDRDVRPTQEQAIDFLRQRGVAVLAEAEGVLGVLRALSVRMGNVPRIVAESQRDWTLIHMRFHDTQPVTATVDITVFNLKPETSHAHQGA